MGKQSNQTDPGKRRILLPLMSGLLMSYLVGCLIFAVGCTRCFYRKQADDVATGLLIEKDAPDWKVQLYHVYPDPRARFADNTDPDHPPMPPDDPGAGQLSPHPQNPGKDGVAEIEGHGYIALLEQWDADNRAELKAQGREAVTGVTVRPIRIPPQPVPVPSEKEPIPPAEKLPVPPKPAPDGKEKVQQPGSEEQVADQDANDKEAGKDGKAVEVVPGNSGSSANTETSLSSGFVTKPGERLPYLIKSEQAVELAFITGREMQDQRENLYLTALAVSLQRFAFAPQFFAAGQGLRDWTGSEEPGGAQNNWTVNSNAGFTQLFSTGALLLANFANQTVANLGGFSRGVVSQSTINLDLIQPFLRGGGLAVTLEPLTQAERNLVYQVRGYARFLKTYYVFIAGGGGGSLTNGTFQPSQVVSVDAFSPTAGFSPSGLFPGSIQLPPVTGNPGLRVVPGPSGEISLQTAINAPNAGYLSTLQEAAQMQIDKYNIEKLDELLKLARATLEGGDISQLQVDLFEQALLTGRKNLVNDQQDYLQELDNLKLQLGIPPDMRIELDDEDFRPLNEHFQRYEDLFSQFKAASDAPSAFNGPNQVGQVRKEMLRLFTTAPVVRELPFSRFIEPRWAVWEKLTADQLDKQLAAYKDERIKLQDRETDLETKGKSLSAEEQARKKTVDFEIDLGTFEKLLRDYEGQPWKKLATPEAQTKRQQAMFTELASAFVIVLTEARNERMAELHEQWPKLRPVCIDGVDVMKADLNDALDVVAKHAVANRLDLMNARGNYVDAWRQLAIFANALLGTVNVQYHVDSSTPATGASPFAFAGSRTHQEAILNTELPIVRVQERNNYRAALINYQRARRIWQRAEDEAKYEPRQELILLRQFEETYRIQTRLIELGYMTRENAQEVFQQPPGALQGNVDTATRAASLTQQLIGAQTGLYTAQFNMTTIWITYLNTRDDLYRDMEFMNLDSRGVWVDDIGKCQCPPAPTAEKPAELPPPKPLANAEPAAE